MKRTLTIIAAAALASCVLAPAATAANESPNPKQVANSFCHDQKKAMKAETGDNKAFKELYGGKRAMQTCKRQNRDEAEEHRPKFLAGVQRRAGCRPRRFFLWRQEERPRQVR